VVDEVEHKHPKVTVALELNESEAEAVGFLLNKGYSTQIKLIWAAEGGTLELSAFINSEADYPEWGSVETESKEVSGKEFQEMKSEYFERLQENNKLLNSEDIPF